MGTKGFVPETHMQLTRQVGSSLDGCHWTTEAQEREQCSRQVGAVPSWSPNSQAKDTLNLT